jgi:hypothetical protein
MAAKNRLPVHPDNLYVYLMRDAVAPSRIPMPSFASSGSSGAPFAPGIGRTQMTLFHTHRGEVFGSGGLRSGSRFSAARARRKISAALKMMHRAIVTAKLRRLRNELMLHRNAQAHGEFDVSKFPQRPMVLGDKWDF